ncbi:hypothetical protein [Maribacter sp. 2-571]|uniref:hypothetical protein n=1 Tax=Maribacter sp. 2-571 TaxID=3417569 RepID=UPI003D3416DE
MKLPVLFLIALTLGFVPPSNVATLGAEPRETGKHLKFDAVITVLEYTEGATPTIHYKVHPYGGSGNYAFKWRVYGQSFDQESGDTFWLEYPCPTDTEKYISKVFCEVTDLQTDLKFETRLYHHVIPCY